MRDPRQPPGVDGAARQPPRVWGTHPWASAPAMSSRLLLPPAGSPSHVSISSAEIPEGERISSTLEGIPEDLVQEIKAEPRSAEIAHEILESAPGGIAGEDVGYVSRTCGKGRTASLWAGRPEPHSPRTSLRIPRWPTSAYQDCGQEGVSQPAFWRFSYSSRRRRLSGLPIRGSDPKTRTLLLLHLSLVRMLRSLDSARL